MKEPQPKRRQGIKGNQRVPSVTVSDVARLARVSTATVSRTINTPDIVRAEVRDRVTAAVQKLGYIPNDSARALRQSQTRLIGVIVPTLSYALYAEFFAAVQTTLGQNGFFALLTTTDYDLQVEAEQIVALAKQGAQGVILVGRLRDPAAANFLAASGIPCINTYSSDPFDSDLAIGFDNARAIGDVVTYLASLGHRRIAMLSGVTSNRNDRAIARLAGFRMALEARNLMSPDWVAEAPYTIEGGRAALCEILDRGLDPTAIVCGSDMLGIGAMQECKARGIHVPDDLSIMGFDNLEITAHLDPPLSTVSVPSKELGILAAESIIALCSGQPPVGKRVLDTHLVPRATTAKPASTQILSKRAGQSK